MKITMGDPVFSEEELGYYRVLTRALPTDCFLPSEVAYAVKLAVLPRLQEAMSDDDIVAAHEGQQPQFDRMRAITCRPCNEVRCPLNPRHDPLGSDPLGALKRGDYMTREAAGKAMLERLLPVSTREELAQKGVRSDAWHMSSRRNPTLVFTFERGSVRRTVSCYIGKGEFVVDHQLQPLHSTHQVQEVIGEIVASFSNGDQPV